MTEKPRETQAESHVVEFKEKVNNSSLMKHPASIRTTGFLSADGVRAETIASPSR